VVAQLRLAQVMTAPISMISPRIGTVLVMAATRPGPVCVVT
jgi:hypothetical protein